MAFPNRSLETSDDISANLVAAPASAENIVLLKAVLDEAGQGLLVVDRSMTVIDFNPRFVEMIGYPVGAVQVGVSVDFLVRLAFALGHYGSATAAQAYQRLVLRLSTESGGRRIIDLADGSTVLTTFRRVDRGWVIIYEDISEQTRNKHALEEQNSRFDAALSHAPHGLCMFDREKRLILCNRAYRRLYNLPHRLCRAGTPLEDIFQFRRTHSSAPHDEAEHMGNIDEANRSGRVIGTDNLLEDGRVIRITRSPMPDGGFVSTHEDVTASVLAEQQARHLASHDPLTGLKNRAAFHAELERLVQDNLDGNTVAVLCLDLDEFKPVNDLFGHWVGDHLLRLVAARFLQCAGTEDIVARWGGDEFMIARPVLRFRSQATEFAASLVDAMRAPFEIEGRRILIGLSVGIAACPADGGSADDLIKNADLALYRAKSAGGRSFQFFQPEMEILARERQRLGIDLRDSLEQQALYLQYQPLVDIETGRIVAFEALLRWHHPELGIISPADFIPLAEETGLIIQIGEWVLRRACQDAARWPAEISVAVNLSPAQFDAGNLAWVVSQALSQSALSPNRLELEITESVQIMNNERTLATLQSLREFGVRIALDDFGTGYSSLSYLCSYPFDKLKIDKSFITELETRTDCAAIVRAITDLSRSLQIKTVAEGVETNEQLEIVARFGCNQAQGYLFSAPCSAETASQLAKCPITIRRDPSTRAGVEFTRPESAPDCRHPVMAALSSGVAFQYP